MGATITLMFSSPVLPAGPNAATGSATLRFACLRGDHASLSELTKFNLDEHSTVMIASESAVNHLVPIRRSVLETNPG